MTQNDRIILDSTQFDLTIKRLAHQLIENHNDFSNSIIIGLQPRGTFLADRIKAELAAAKLVVTQLKTKYSEQAEETQKAVQNVNVLKSQLDKAETELGQIANAFAQLTGSSN